MILNAFDRRMDHRSVVESIPPIVPFSFFVLFLGLAVSGTFEVICLVIGHLGGAAGGPRP